MFPTTPPPPPLLLLLLLPFVALPLCTCSAPILSLSPKFQLPPLMKCRFFPCPTRCPFCKKAKRLLEDLLENPADYEVGNPPACYPHFPIVCHDQRT